LHDTINKIKLSKTFVFFLTKIKAWWREVEKYGGNITAGAIVKK